MDQLTRTTGTGTIATGAPAPTGGPVTAAEAVLQGNAQFPAPLIYAAVGDVVEIRLKNLGVDEPTCAERSAQHPPAWAGCGRGQRRCAGDLGRRHTGQPVRRRHDRQRAAATPAPGAGNVVVYMFSPKYPGTTMYHCHQEADIHVQMGMYGALVVYSANDKSNAKSAYNNGGPGSGFGGQVVGLGLRQGLRPAGV